MTHQPESRESAVNTNIGKPDIGGEQDLSTDDEGTEERGRFVNNYELMIKRTAIFYEMTLPALVQNRFGKQNDVLNS